MDTRKIGVKRGIFGLLSRAPRGAGELWHLIVEHSSENTKPMRLPRDLWQDARTLVELGLLDEPQEGLFSPAKGTLRVESEK